MNINNFLKSPIVNLIAMLGLIYFLFSSTRDNPRSIAHQLSSEKIKNNTQNLINKTALINESIKQSAPEKIQQNELSKNNNLFKDIKIGDGDLVAICGDEALISYFASDNNGKQLKNIESLKILIGAKKHNFFEKNILGMKSGGIRFIEAIKGHEINDEAIIKILNSANSDVKFLINLKKITRNPTYNLNCQ